MPRLDTFHSRACYVRDSVQTRDFVAACRFMSGLRPEIGTDDLLILAETRERVARLMKESALCKLWALLNERLRPHDEAQS